MESIQQLIRPFKAEYEDYLRDESRITGQADSISFPKTEQELAQILRELQQRGEQITVQGGRTGLTAAAVPQGGHILNTARLSGIHGARYEAQTDSFYVRVGPGLALSELRKALADKSFDVRGWDAADKEALSLLAPGAWFFPTDPTESSALLGGIIACNASGARSFAYGPVRQHISALRLMLADGDTISLKRGQCLAQGHTFRLETDGGRQISGTLPSYQMPATKNAAGFYVHADLDLLDLFIGSEGNLAIITEAELRLQRTPEAIWGISAFFATEAQALRYVRALRGETEAPLPEQPVAIEFFNHQALALLRRQKQENPAFAQIQDLPAHFHTCIYVEFHSTTEQLWQLLPQLAAMIEAVGGQADDSWVAHDERALDKLIFFRHAVPECVNMLIDNRRRRYPSLTKLGTDMAVPDADLERVMEMYEADLTAAGLEQAIWGHIGDNHLHVNILPRDEADYQKGKALYAVWAERVSSWGGTISAEHGAGKLKAAFLQTMYGEQAIQQMRSLKQLFDPEMRLNRGNMFQP